MEYGIVVAQSTAQIRKKLTSIIDDSANELTPLGRELFRDLQIQFYAIDEKFQNTIRKLKDCVEKLKRVND